MTEEQTGMASDLELDFDLDTALDEMREEKKTPLADIVDAAHEKKVDVPEPVVEDDVKETEKKQEKPSEEKDVESLKVAYEKLEKSHKDTQKSFHESRKQQAAYKKAVEKLKAEGVLLDEEAEFLLAHAKDDVEHGEESEYMKFHKIWNQELQYMRKYDRESKDIDKHFEAFQHFVQTAPSQEIVEVFSDLKSYEDDEVEFTKKMLEYGRDYYDDIYADISDTGSIRNLKSKYSQKQTDMQKVIDKLTKENDNLKQKFKEKHEDYDTSPSGRLPTGSGSSDLPKLDKVDLDAFFDSLGGR